MQPIDFLYRSAALRPDAPAVDGPRGVLSYRTLADHVSALAAGLQALDPAPQSRVGVCGYNSLEHLVGMLAAMAADKVWVPLNPRDSRSDLDAKMEATRPSILILDENCSDRLSARPPHLVIGETAAPSGAGDTVAGLVDRHHGCRPARTGLSLALPQAIKFTGGSSGRPKGVLQPYRAWTAGAAGLVHGLGLRAGDRYLVAAPLTHGTSCYVTPFLAAGGTFVLMGDRTTPAAILDAFAERAVTTTFLPPTLIYMLMAEPGVGDRRFPALRHLVYGGASMPAEKIRAAQALFGPVLATNYGQTEAPQIITLMSPEEFREEGLLSSVGRASLLARAEVMDPQGRILPVGEAGEIVVRGDLVMSGYLDMPEATAETLVDGWLHTGDVGVFDARGYLYLRDRIRDVIITGGFNVYPSDVEAALSRHPAVHEVVVFGLSDEKWGEAVQAAVQLRPDATVTPQELIAFAKGELGSVKAPKAVHVVADLPRNSVGKVVRREVRAMLAPPVP